MINVGNLSALWLDGKGQIVDGLKNSNNRTLYEMLKQNSWNSN